MANSRFGGRAEAREQMRSREQLLEMQEAIAEHSMRRSAKAEEAPAVEEVPTAPINTLSLVPKIIGSDGASAVN